MYGFNIKIKREVYTKSIPLKNWFELWDDSHPSAGRGYMYFASPDRLKVEEAMEYHIRAEQYLKGERKQYPKSEVLIYG